MKSISLRGYSPHLSAQEYPHDVVLMQLLHRFSAFVVMGVTYGYELKEEESFLKSMQRAADTYLRYARPEISVVCATFPFCECLPSYYSLPLPRVLISALVTKALPAWFPGMGFKYAATECRPLSYEGLHAPYTWVKRRTVRSRASDRVCVANVEQGGRKRTALHGG